MWILSLIEQLTGFIPRPKIVRADEGGFRQVPKPWNGWPWVRWPWVRWLWIKKPWAMWPWAPKDNQGSTWITEMVPGEWYWLIPWIMEHEVSRIKTQVVDLRIQSVWTSDGYDIAIGGAIRYYISKAMDALLNVQDYDDSLRTLGLGVIFEFVRKHTLEELRSGIDDLKADIVKQVREESKGWGLKIQQVLLTDAGKARNIRLLGNSSGAVSQGSI